MERGRETPILMITLVIPAVDEISADAIMDAIGQQLQQALEAVRAQQNGELEMPEADESAVATMDPEFKASLLNEKVEEFTDGTRADLLSALGYKPDA